MEEKIKLFCIPHAGGNSGYYYKWKCKVHKKIEVIPLEYKGRGARFKEALYQNFDEILNDMYEQLKSEIGYNEFAFFGHSMGGLVVFELSRKLKEEINIEPKHLFISGRYAPNIKRFNHSYHDLSDDEFLKKMVEVGGIPEKLLIRKKFLSLYLNVLKHDFKALDTYELKEKVLLSCDITTINGKEDSILEKDIRDWCLYSNGKISQYFVNGGHFYLFDQEDFLIKVICEALIR